MPVALHPSVSWPHQYRSINLSVPFTQDLPSIKSLQFIITENVDDCILISVQRLMSDSTVTSDAIFFLIKGAGLQNHTEQAPTIHHIQDPHPLNLTLEV